MLYTAVLRSVELCSAVLFLNYVYKTFTFGGKWVVFMGFMRSFFG